MRGRESAVVAVAVLMAGCSTSWLPWPSSSEGPKGPYTPPGAKGYACEGGKRLLVRFESGGKSAWVIYSDHQLRLDRVTSASGEEYSRAGTTLSVKDDGAALIEGNAVQLTGCKPEIKP